MLRAALVPAAVALLTISVLAPGHASAERPPVGKPAVGPQPAAGPAASEGGLAVFFSPDGGALAAVADLITRARRTIDVQAYLLTTKELAEPLAQAHRRGVKVRILIDADNATPDRGLATSLAEQGVPVFTDAEHKEAHDKVMIIDAQAVITGSFNFTRAADTENAENLLVITGRPKIIAAYQRHFEQHLAHGKRLGR